MRGNKDWDGWNFLKIQESWQNLRRANGIRVEYFPRIQNVAALWQNQQSSELFRRNTRKFHRKNLIDVDVQRHFLWIRRQWTRMLGEWPLARFSVCKKIWKRTMVISWSWFERSGVVSVKIVDNRLLLEIAESDCPIFRAASPLSRVDSKAKDMENCLYSMQPIWDRLRHFFA